MVAQKQKIIDRTKKILALAESPNPHEAARAKEQARALMEKHGLTADDVSDEEIFILEQRATADKRTLASAAALAHECDAISSRTGAVALRGIGARITQARECYRSLTQAADECMKDQRVKNSPQPVRDAWRAATWLGYVEAVEERCRELRESRRRPKKVETKAPVKYEAPPVPPAQAPQLSPEEAYELTKDKMVRDTQKLVYGRPHGADPEWLFREAYALGFATGMRVDLSGNEVAAGGALSDGKGK